MRITLRLTLSLVLATTLVAAFFSFLQVKYEKRMAMQELEHRCHLLAESLHESVSDKLDKGKSDKLQSIAQRFENKKGLSGIGIYDGNQSELAATPSLAGHKIASKRLAGKILTGAGEAGMLRIIDEGKKCLYGISLIRDGEKKGALTMVSDIRHIGLRQSVIWRSNFIRLFIQIVLISVIILLVVRWNITSPIFQLADWMKKVRIGSASSHELPRSNLFTPILREASRFAKSLNAAKAAAEEEASLRQAAESLWTAERLKTHVLSKLGDAPLFVVSNREPYMHLRKGNKVEVTVPASGMVTALEPVLRACGGTWIAHGGGSADRETVDSHDHIKVPFDEPAYTLRRVWLSKEEENGYYYGFSNEGLWPLCHIAHTRPIFRVRDWEQYTAVNQKFADAVLEEVGNEDGPYILIQDYHFALLPRMIKERRPDARVAVFWHIPWTNPEAFGICPWQKELLDGMLGADLIGFHIQLHCNNFLDTVDRVLESRIDWEHFSITRSDHTTFVKHFEIGIAVSPEETQADKTVDKNALLKDLDIKAEFLGVGVDRVDYTKGIMERFHSVERFFEKYPEYRERFTFVEIGAPSRTLIKRYHNLCSEVSEETDRINWKFQTRDWRPIVFFNRHHSHKEIEQFYKAADLCIVTSLHDGMNLVAKEFVASRSDGKGVLILSCFTGASREMRDALIINPYDTEQTAEAIYFALGMADAEKRFRMERLRQAVRENNVYRWGGRLIGALAELRIDEKSK